MIFPILKRLNCKGARFLRILGCLDEMDNATPHLKTGYRQPDELR